MTHVSEHARHSARAGAAAASARWAAVRLSALSGGTAAAGLGLGCITAVVLLLWIGSPFPDSDLAGALHAGAGIWLLAQGAGLVRGDSVTGSATPVGLTPLLLSALPAWLLFRGTASAVSAAALTGTLSGPPGTRSRAARTGGASPARRTGPGTRTGPHGDEEAAYDTREVVLITGWVLAGYLTLAVLAVVYTAGGALRVDPLSAVLHVPVFALGAAVCGAWSGSGRPVPAHWRPGRARRYGQEAADGLRAAGVGGGVLLCGGALVGAAALVWHIGAVGDTFAALSGALTGQVAVLLIALGLMPNLAVWVVCYGLGVGFVAGAGGAVAPGAVTGHLSLPSFPLLAAVPGAGPAPAGWATLALPVAAGLAVAWTVGNSGHTMGGTARTSAWAGLALGLGSAVAAAWSGGSLGSHALADFGPTWWRAGGAAAGWTLAITLPCATVVGYHLAHPPTPWRSLMRRLPRLLWTLLRRLPHLLWVLLRRLLLSGPRTFRPAAEPLPGQAAASDELSTAVSGTGVTAEAPGRFRFALRRQPLGSDEAPTGASTMDVPAAPGRFRLPRLALRRSAPAADEAPTAASAIDVPATPLPAPGDPLPWPSPPPLPLFPPPLPDLPPSAPPPKTSPPKTSPPKSTPPQAPPPDAPPAAEPPPES